QHKLAFDRRLSVIIRGNGFLECLVIVGILKRADDRLAREAMAKRIAARYLLSGFGFRPSTAKCIAAIGLDLPVRGHGLPAKLASFCNFGPPVLIARGNGCVFSHKTRAAALGSIPVFCHHTASSPQQCASR